MGNRSSKQSRNNYHPNTTTIIPQNVQQHQHNPLKRYITSQDRDNHDVYVVGCDVEKQFLVANKTLFNKNSDVYTKDNVTNIHCGRNFNIYQTQNNRFWGAGNNQFGECGTAQDPKDMPHHPLMEIKYFHFRNIPIKNVYTSCVSSNTFWITTDGKVYGNGINDYYQLGLGHSQHQFTPKYIPTLSDVIDIKSSFHHCMAICNNKTDCIYIIDSWCSSLTIQIPKDIVNLIGIFCGRYEIYSTGIGNNGHGGATIKQWKKISIFKNEIIRVECGSYHTLWLESNGTVWSTGANMSGVLGLGHCKDVESFKQPIPYFVRRKIIVVDIKCGYSISSVLDSNGKVYCWGRYDNGGSWGTVSSVKGFHEDENPNEPQWMKSLDGCNIIEIKCGSRHFYAKSDNDKHFLWGKNSYNECLTFENELDALVHEPFCINDIVSSKLNGAKIKAVYLGQCNTQLIVVKQQ